MSSLYDSKGRKIRDVRNLGWLLRHWQTVRMVRILPPKGRGLHDARMVVYMDAERTSGGAAEYRTDWGSARLLWDWLRRPVLIGVPLEWGTEPARPIGEGEYPGEPDERTGYANRCPDGSASTSGGVCRCDRCIRARERY